MKIFVAASYSTKVDYDTGAVFPYYKKWLEEVLTDIESFGHQVICALREDNYKINQSDPAEAYRLDVKKIEGADVLLALLEDSPSTGVQTEIGYAIAKGKKVILGHDRYDELLWFNKAMLAAGVVSEVVFPVTKEKIEKLTK